jgi:hypothetical protein
VLIVESDAGLTTIPQPASPCILVAVGKGGVTRFETAGKIAAQATAVCILTRAIHTPGAQAASTLLSVPRQVDFATSRKISIAIREANFATRDDTTGIQTTHVCDV